MRCLCHLLSDDRLRENAAECLLAVVSWKAGKAADRAQLLSLFETDMMAPLFAAAEKANAKALAEDRDYNFLKKLVQVSRYSDVVLVDFKIEVLGHFYGTFHRRT